MSDSSPDDPRPLGPAIIVLSAARLVVNTLERFVYPFLPTIARGLGIPLEQAGLLLSLRSGAAIGVPGMVRVLGARGRQRRQMTVALVALALGAFVIVGPWGVRGAALGFAVVGMAKLTYDNGAQTYLSQRTSYAQRARVLGWLELTFAGGLLIGTPIVGLLIGWFGWRAGFIAVGVGSLAMVGVVRRVTEPGHPEGADEPERLQLNPAALSLLGVVGLYMLGTEVSFVSIGAWMEDDLGVGLAGLGGLAILLGLAEALGEGVVIARADALGKRSATLLGLGIGVVGFGLLATVGTTIVTGIGALALALFGFEIAIVATIPLASELLPRARGAFLAWLGVAIMAGRSVGAILGPWLYVRHGMDAVAGTSAVTYLVAMGLLALLLTDDRGHTIA